MSCLRKVLVCCLLLLGVTSVSAGQGAEYVNGYFDIWLKNHHFTGYEKRGNGIYFPSNGVLLDGEINEAKELRAGQFYSVESRISVTFKNGRRLDDFVGGIGPKANDAFYDSLQNFCLTTLHPIYAELFDHADPHVRKQSWSVGGTPRRIFLSDWGSRGVPFPEAFRTEVETAIAQELASAKVSKDIHWVKLVVYVEPNQVKELVVTVDGERQEALIKKLASFAWPKPTTFSMSKLFFVVGAL